MRSQMSGAMRALGLALCLALTVGLSRAALRVPHGLTAEYWAGPDRSGSVAFTALDDDVSTAQVARRWHDDPPPSFSVRWHGYLAVGRADVYRFETTSDDGSWLYVDGRLVVDNGGTHGAVTQSGQIWLDRGPHFVLLEYSQSGGLYALEWSWGRGDAPLTPVPGWRLSPRRASNGLALAARALDWIWWMAIVGVLVATLATVRHGHAQLPLVVRGRPRVASLALFVALAVVHTWPLVSDPAHLSRNDNADTILNEWTLAWFAHQAPRAPLDWARGEPLGLFDANIFFPERTTLAYSESLFAQGAMGAPLLWLGASPVLTYNVLLIAGFALTGWAMCLVLVRWTGDWVAALTGGLLMGFNAHTLTRMPHLQAQHVEFLPFALVALDRLLVDPRVRRSVVLAGWFSLQALTSFYLMVFTAVAMVAAVAVRPADWIGRRSTKVAGCLAGAAGLAIVALLPVLLAYWQVHRGQGFTRHIDDVAGFAATWHDYLTTPGRIPRLWIARWGSVNGLYPGAVGLTLAAVAIGSGIAFRDARPRMCLAFGICGVVLSFGPQVPGYEWLYRVFPPLQGIRAVARFGYLGIVAVAILAAYGVARIRCWLRELSWGRPVSLLIVALVALEPLAAPIRYTRFDRIPHIYDHLAHEPGAIVLEVPLPVSRGIFFNAPYMLNSTVHWKPMLNGYSGFIPASYYDHYEHLRSFPATEAVAALRTIGVTHVFAHRNALGPARSSALDGVTELQRLAEEGDIVLYRVAPAARP